MKALKCEGSLKVERDNQSIHLTKKRNSLQKEDIGYVTNHDSTAIPQQLNRLQRLSTLPLPQSNSIAECNTNTIKVPHLRSKRSNSNNYNISAEDGKADDYFIKLSTLKSGSSVDSFDKQIGNKHLMQVFQSAASSQPRGAQFIEVEMHEGNNNSVENNVETDFAGSNGKDNTSEKRINVVVHNELRASKNDRILQEKLMEAKSLSRKNEMGAVMHTFALWGNSTATDVTGDGSVQVDAKSSNSDEVTSVEVIPEIIVHNDSPTPKLPRKLRGPLAAREALGLNSEKHSDSPPFKGDRSEKYDKLHIDIEEGDYPEDDEEINQNSKITTSINSLGGQQLGQGHARLASHLRSMVGQAKCLSTSSSAGSDILKQFLPSSIKIASELVTEGGVTEDVIRDTICSHLQLQVLVGLQYIDVASDLGEQLLEHNLASLSSEEHYDENSFCVDTAIISFGEIPEPSPEDNYSEVVESDGDLSSVEEEEEMRVKMRARDDGRVDSAMSGSTASRSNRRENGTLPNDQASCATLASVRAIGSKQEENEGIIRCCSNCPGAAVNVNCDCLPLSADQCRSSEHIFRDDCTIPIKCSEAMVSPSNEHSPIQTSSKAITLSSEQESNGQELSRRDKTFNRRLKVTSLTTPPSKNLLKRNAPSSSSGSAHTHHELSSYPQFSLTPPPVSQLHTSSSCKYVSNTPKNPTDAQSRRMERSTFEITPSTAKIRYSRTAPPAHRKPPISSNSNNLKQAQTVSPLKREKIPQRKRLDSGSSDTKSKVPSIPSRLNATMTSSHERSSVVDEFDGIKPIKLFSKSLPLKSESSAFVSRSDSKDDRNPVLKFDRKRNGSLSKSPVLVERKGNSSAQLLLRQKESLSKEKEQEGIKFIEQRKPSLDMSTSLLSVATDLDFSQLSLLKYPPVKIDSTIQKNVERRPSEKIVISNDLDMERRPSAPTVIEVDLAVTARSISPSLSELSQEEYPQSQSESETETDLPPRTSNNPSKDQKNKFDKVDEKLINGTAVDSDVHVAEGIGLNCSPLRWRRGQVIGEGTFGRVYKGMNENTGELLAVKQLSLAGGTKAEVSLLRKEIQVMWDLDHENIVRYLGTGQSDKYLFIILEYVPGGSIQNMLTQFGAFSESLIWRFSSQILAGVDYLHQKGIIHRDIKGANVLVTDAGVAKLADFGCSKQLTGLCTASLEESLRAIKGSVPWMAPEVIKQSGHGRSSDIWSVGATIIEMATGKPPWLEFTNSLAALFHVATSLVPPPIPPNLSPPCATFLSRCMMINAQDRATAAELLVDPYLLLGCAPKNDSTAVDEPAVGRSRFNSA